MLVSTDFLQALDRLQWRVEGQYPLFSLFSGPPILPVDFLKKRLLSDNRWSLGYRGAIAALESECMGVRS